MRPNSGHIKLRRNDLEACVMIKRNRLFARIAPNIIYFLPAQIGKCKIYQLIAQALPPIFINSSHTAQLVTNAGKFAISLRVE